MELIIKNVCREKGIPLKKVAKELGISRQALHARMRNNPTLNSLTEIADVMGVHVIELIEPPAGFHHAYLNGYWIGVGKGLEE